jgi:hypothetical protein
VWLWAKTSLSFDPNNALAILRWGLRLVPVRRINAFLACAAKKPTLGGAHIAVGALDHVINDLRSGKNHSH